MINPRWLELPLSRINFHGPKGVRAIEVRLYLALLLVFLSFFERVEILLCLLWPSAWQAKPMPKIVAYRRSTTNVLNVTKTVVDLPHLSQPTKTRFTKTSPNILICPRFTATVTIVVNRGQNHDSVAGV